MNDKTALDSRATDAKLVDTVAPQTDELRAQAVTELRKRRELVAHLMVFLLVNAFLVLIWYATGASFFWPVFPILGWGIGLFFHAWDVLWPQPSETAIRSTMDRIAHRR